MKKYNLINNSLGWLCFLIAMVSYMLTLEPTASFWDCPEFISQGAKLEIGHPPGNPMFILTARFFVTLFGGDMSMAAYAVNSMSAFFSAATILLLFWTITHLCRKLIVGNAASEVSPVKMAVIMGAGMCGALAYAWSDTFWFSAVEGEVYAFSSFCTALVFWLILKWENRADQPHSDRYLVLIAYVIGVSIAVHLLNLLCIPAIVLVFYYRKFKNTNVKGSLIALVVSFVLIALILYGLVPGFIKVAQGFELVFINGFGMSYNMGVLIYVVLIVTSLVMCIRSMYMQKSVNAIKLWFFLSIVLSGIPFIGHSGWVWVILIAALAAYIFLFCEKVPVRVFNVITLSILVIFIGYSSYTLILIRANTNTPMNQNSPDNVFALGSYLNREQYGDNPLIYGPVFAERLADPIGQDENKNLIYEVDERGYPAVVSMGTIQYTNDGFPMDIGEDTYNKKVKSSPDEPDEYVLDDHNTKYATAPELNMLFTRMYSGDMPRHVSGYKSWSETVNEDFENIPDHVLKKWAAQGYVSEAELAPYIQNTIEVATMVNEDGDPVRVEKGWKATPMQNLRYFINYQLNHMYWRYFMWNFAGRQNDISGNGEPNLGNWLSGIPFLDNLRLGDQSELPDEFGKGNKGHNVYYMLPLILGLIGLLWQALCKHKNAGNRGIEQFWVIFFLFFMTGIAIVLYLNQTPGQPRERDYAFAGSFYAFAIWIGLGVPAIWDGLKKILSVTFSIDKKPADVGANKADFIPNKAGNKQLKNELENESLANTDKTVTTATDNIEYVDESYEHKKSDMSCWVAACIAIAIGIVVPLQMVSQTWDDHDRSGRYTTRDFGFNYLNSLEPDAIIFTNGDNDTFPLWYAQEVEGERTDVKVVNLSYLTTGWYAEQMRYPTYDAPGVPMYARSQDYAYRNNNNIYNDPVIDGYLYTDEYFPKLYRQGIVDRFRARTFEAPELRSRLDREVAKERFNVASGTPEYEVLDDLIFPVASLGYGVDKSKILTIDIIAKNADLGWKRPVYFASTVSSPFSDADRYFVGLDPFMSSTGMAYQVTPFNQNLPEAKNVAPTAEKGYENIMSKFRWGGLDKPDAGKLYLDETVRRMISSTRHGVISVAQDLIRTGDKPASAWAKEWAAKKNQPIPQTHYDMGRNLMELIQQKIPESICLYEQGEDIELASMYAKLYAETGNPADRAAAVKLIDAGEKRFAQWIKYAATLTDREFGKISRYQKQQYYFPAIFAGIENYLDVRDALAKNPENAEMIDRIDHIFDTEYWTSPYVSQNVFVDVITEEDINNLFDTPDPQNQKFAGVFATIVEANRAAGLSPNDQANKYAQKNKVNIRDWKRIRR